MTPETQLVFCSLLKYFHHGDFSTFRRICLIACPESSGENYFATECFLSSLISGFIEVSETENSTWWWVAFDEQIEINSEVSKKILTSELKGSQAVLIANEKNVPLVYGREIGVYHQVKKSYGVNFLSRFPTFLEIEKDIVLKEVYRLEYGLHVELFDLECLAWSALDQSQIRGSHLIRVRKEFSGLKYYIVQAELGLLFRISNPEWAFLAAINILCWPIDKVVTFHESGISFSRRIKFPTAVLRYLFASSRRCSVGQYVQFFDIDTVAKHRFKLFLNNWSEAHAH